MQVGATSRRGSGCVQKKLNKNADCVSEDVVRVRLYN